MTTEQTLLDEHYDQTLGIFGGHPEINRAADGCAACDDAQWLNHSEGGHDGTPDTAHCGACAEEAAQSEVNTRDHLDGWHNDGKPWPNCPLCVA